MIKPWFKNKKEFKQFLTVVILSAPDDFKKEDYLPESEQLNLHNSFELLFYGLRYVENEVQSKKFKEVFDRALSLYKSGLNIEAARLLVSIREELERGCT